jgi:hypothetical protein
LTRAGPLASVGAATDANHTADPDVAGPMPTLSSR